METNRLIYQGLWVAITWFLLYDVTYNFISIVISISITPRSCSLSTYCQQDRSGLYSNTYSLLLTMLSISGTRHRWIGVLVVNTGVITKTPVGIVAAAKTKHTVFWYLPHPPISLNMSSYSIIFHRQLTLKFRNATWTDPKARNCQPVVVAMQRPFVE